MDKAQNQLLLPLSSSIQSLLTSEPATLKQDSAVNNSQCTVINFPSYALADKQYCHRKELVKEVIEYANKFDW